MLIYCFFTLFCILNNVTGHKHHTCIHNELAEKMGKSMNFINVDQVDNAADPILHDKHRRLETASYGGIRIHFDTEYIDNYIADSNACTSSVDSVFIFGDLYNCGINDVLTESKKTFLLNTMLPTIKAWFADTLEVVQKSNPIAYAGFPCNDQGSFTCCDDQIPTQVKNGVSNTDIIIMVTARPASSSSTIAWALACGLDSTTQRPLVGQINFTPSHLDPSLSARNAQISVALHEMAHALGFSSGLYSYYREPNNGATRAQVLEVIPVSHPQNKLGREFTQIITPNVIEKAKLHFGCSDWPIPGLEIEDFGGSGTAGSHWEKRIMEDEFMTGIAGSSGVISKMTLALFEDMGWYQVNYDSADTFLWGYQQGCYFAREKCSSWTSLPRFFCTGTNADGCTHDFNFLGRCTLNKKGGNLPSHQQYFVDAKYGGNAVDDYCPRYMPFATNADCRDSNSDSRAFYGEQRGVNSRCFAGTHAQGIALSTATVRCHEINCSGSILKVKVGSSSWITCPFNGGSHSVSGQAGVYLGTLECPSYFDICSSSSTCPFACSNRGSCQSDGTCNCNFGYHGEGCQKIKCPENDGEICSGNGSCNDDTGECQCVVNEEGIQYTGAACDELECPQGTALGGSELLSCSGNGVCNVTAGICACSDAYFGEGCEYEHCPLYNDTSGVECTGKGSCDTINGACSCSYIPCNSEQDVNITCPYDPPVPFYTGLGCESKSELGANRYTVINGSISGAQVLYDILPGNVSKKGVDYYTVEIDSISTNISITVTDVKGDVDVYASFTHDPPSTGIGGYTWSSTRGTNEEENIIIKSDDTLKQTGLLNLAVFGRNDSLYNITIEQDPCSIEAFSRCSGHGSCVSGRCECDMLWSGEQCDSPDCLGTPDCSDHGSCVLDKGVPTCVCSPGWDPAYEMCNVTLDSIKSFTIFGPDGGSSSSYIDIGQWAFFQMKLDTIDGDLIYVNLTSNLSNADPMLLANVGDLPSLTKYSAFDATSWNLQSTQASLLLDVPNGLRAGEWFIGVYNSLYGSGRLYYDIDVKRHTECPEVMESCSGHGSCTISTTNNVPSCTCNNTHASGADVSTLPGGKTYHGLNCGIEVYNFQNGESYDFQDIPVGEWRYAAIHVTSGRELNITMSLNTAGSTSDPPLLMVSRGNIPSLDKQAFIDFSRSTQNGMNQNVRISGSNLVTGTYFIGIHNRRYGNSRVSVTLSASVLTEVVPLDSCDVIESINDNDNDNDFCSSVTCNCRGRCFVDGTAAQCTCDESWHGINCNIPVLRSLSSLLEASQNVELICNLCEREVQLQRGEFKLYRIPQPLGTDSGLRITIGPSTNTTSSATSSGDDDASSLSVDADLYISEELPRSIYDFKIIQALDRESEEFYITEKSASGRFWMAIYAKVAGTYLVQVQREIIISTDDDKYFVNELYNWLTNTPTGNVTLGLATGVVSLIVLGCMLRLCCFSKDDFEDYHQILSNVQNNGTKSAKDLFGLTEASNVNSLNRGDRDTIASSSVVRRSGRRAPVAAPTPTSTVLRSRETSNASSHGISRSNTRTSRTPSHGNATPRGRGVHATGLVELATTNSGNNMITTATTTSGATSNLSQQQISPSAAPSAPPILTVSTSNMNGYENAVDLPYSNRPRSVTRSIRSPVLATRDAKDAEDGSSKLGIKGVEV